MPQLKPKQDIAAIPNGKKMIRYWVEGHHGLFLQVEAKPSQSKFWRQHIRWPKGSKSGVSLSHGVFPRMTLKQAIRLADNAHHRVEAGIDPRPARAVQPTVGDAPRLTGTSFEAIAMKWYNKAKNDWTEDTAKRYLKELKRDVFKYIGKDDIVAVDRPAIYKVMERIDKQRHPTAYKTMGQIDAIFDKALTMGLIEQNPITDTMRKDFAAPKFTKHHAAVPAKDLHKVMGKLVAIDTPASKALQWIISTASRIDEALGATQDEIKGGLWTIPIARLKTRKKIKTDLVRPMSSRMHGLAKHIPFDTSETAVRNLLVEVYPKLCPNIIDADGTIGYEPATPHGTARTNFETWGREHGASEDDIQAMMGHAIKGSTRQAYDRSTRIEPRRTLLEDWARALLTSPEQTS